MVDFLHVMLDIGSMENNFHLSILLSSRPIEDRSLPACLTFYRRFLSDFCSTVEDRNNRDSSFHPGKHLRSRHTTKTNRTKFITEREAIELDLPLSLVREPSVSDRPENILQDWLGRCSTVEQSCSEGEDNRRLD